MFLSMPTDELITQMLTAALEKACLDWEFLSDRAPSWSIASPPKPEFRAPAPERRAFRGRLHAFQRPKD